MSPFSILKDGYVPPKGGPNWVKNPNPGRGGSSHGWQDKKGDVWCPSGNHLGEHMGDRTGMLRHQEGTIETYARNRTRSTMKNIQIIDGAVNCTYSLFAAPDKGFNAIFPKGTDIEFIEDVIDRLGEAHVAAITEKMWKRPVKKPVAKGIHGTLFYQLLNKKRFYPTKKESEMDQLGVNEPTESRKRKKTRKGSGNFF
jgi:putative RNase toxin 37 of polymorphic toxin system